jgi:hypothetical protein
MTRYVSADDEKLSSLLPLTKDETIMVEQDGKAVAVIISPEVFGLYSRDREQRIEALLALRDRLSDEAQRNGLTEEKLAEILADE